MNPIDHRPEEPRPDVVRVPACPGCGGMPHGSIKLKIDCLARALAETRAQLASAHQAVSALGGTLSAVRGLVNR